MIVIYDQEKTYIESSADDARDVLISVYGEKLGKEAYVAVNDAPVGASYRSNGGPLVQVVDKEKAQWIKEKEESIGMMQRF